MRKSLLAMALVALLPACSDNSTNNPSSPSSPSPPSNEPTPEPTEASITVTVNPVLVPAVANADPSLPWSIAWQTTVRETAGISGTVTTIDVHLVDFVITYTGANLAAASTSGSPNLASKGTLTFNQAIAYDLPNGGRLAVVGVVVWVRDSKGKTISQVAQLRIV